MSKEIKLIKNNDNKDLNAVLRETIEDILFKTGMHLQSECSELADAIISDLPTEKQGAVWVKASERLPVSTKPPELLIVKWQTIGGNYMLRYMTSNQLADLVKEEVVLHYEWLDESGTAGGAADPDELWDEFSELIDDDIDSLTRWAGSVVMTKEGWRKVVGRLKQKNR